MSCTTGEPWRLWNAASVTRYIVTLCIGWLELKEYVASSGSTWVRNALQLRIMMQTQRAQWTESELQGLQAGYPDVHGAYDTKPSKYNPRPGTGRTGYLHVAPNNYPFYSEEEKYIPIMQADGGQLSDWKPMYQPSAEQAEKDRMAAYEAGVPHGYVPPGNRYKDLPTIHLQVVSELHEDFEYGAEIGADGQHSGGPFLIDVSPTMRIEDVRLLIQAVGGIIPALQKLSYAGKNFEDSQRSLQQYGVAYWHKKFPHWPIRIRRC